MLPQFLLQKAGPEDRVGGRGGGFVFYTDDMAATHRELEARGVRFTDPPKKEPWSFQAMFTDPDENVHVLLQQ